MFSLVLKLQNAVRSVVQRSKYKCPVPFILESRHLCRCVYANVQANGAEADVSHSTLLCMTKFSKYIFAPFLCSWTLDAREGEEFCRSSGVLQIPKAKVRGVPLWDFLLHPLPFAYKHNSIYLIIGWPEPHTVYLRFFWQGNHQIYDQIQCTCL